MLQLFLLWLFSGFCIGLLVHAAYIRPFKAHACQWLIQAVLGAFTASVGGLAGVILLGNYFSLAVALWFSIAVITGLYAIKKRKREFRTEQAPS